MKIAINYIFVLLLAIIHIGLSTTNVYGATVNECPSSIYVCPSGQCVFHSSNPPACCIQESTHLNCIGDATCIDSGNPSPECNTSPDTTTDTTTDTTIDTTTDIDISTQCPTDYPSERIVNGVQLCCTDDTNQAICMRLSDETTESESEEANLICTDDTGELICPPNMIPSCKNIDGTASICEVGCTPMSVEAKYFYPECIILDENGMPQHCPDAAIATCVPNE